MIGRVQLLRGITGERRIDADIDAMVGLEAEVLVLHLLQAANEQASHGEQDDRDSCLHHREGFLWQG